MRHGWETTNTYLTLYLSLDLLIYFEIVIRYAAAELANTSEKISIFKRRLDIEKLQPQMEHLWIEIPCRNKKSKLLLGVTYQSERIMQTSASLEGFGTMLAHLTAPFDGLLLITGDVNVGICFDSAIFGHSQYVQSTVGSHKADADYS